MEENSINIFKCKNNPIQITLDPGNLDWPEQYIVMDKQIV